MKNRIGRICDKLATKKGFVNYWAVLFADVILSIVSTCITLLFINGFVIGSNERVILSVLVYSGLVSAFVFYFFRISKNIIRHASIKSVSRIGIAIIVKELLLFIIATILDFWLSVKYLYVFCFIDLLITIVVLVGFRVVLILIYDTVVSQFASRKTRVLVYGTSDKSVALKKRMYTSKHFHVVGFVNSDRSLRSYSISELPVYQFSEESTFIRFVGKHNIGGIIFPSYEDARKEQDHLVKFCQNNNVKGLVSPPIDVLGNGLKRTVIREIEIEDLLGRDEIKINMREIMDSFSGKIVMVTGAAGSIGSELCRQLATFGIRHLVLFDNAETPHA